MDKIEKIVMSKEDIEAKIELGDEAFINDLLSGKVVQGEPEVVEQVEEPVENVTEIPEVVEKQEEEEVDNSYEEYTKELIAMREKFKKEQEEAQRLIEENKKVLEDEREKYRREMDEMREKLETLKTAQTKVTKIEEDEDDVDLAGRFSKNNRALIESLEARLGEAANNKELLEIKNELKTLREAEKQREAKLQEEAAKREREKAEKKLFAEVEAFQARNSKFKTEAPVSELYTQHIDLKKRLGEFIRSSNMADVDKALYSAVRGTSKKDESFRKELAKAGVEIPEWSEDYMKLVDIVSLKNGVKFNKYTGEYDPITDEFGNQVCQRNLEDAYKLSEYYNQMSEVAVNAAKEVQEKLMARENSATILSNSEVVSEAEQEVMSAERMNELLDMPEHVISTNPALARELDRVFAQLGMKK